MPDVLINHTTATQKEMDKRKGFAKRIVTRLNQVAGPLEWSLDNWEETILAGGVGTRYSTYAVLFGTAYTLDIAVTEYKRKQVGVLCMPLPVGTQLYVSDRITKPDTFTIRDVNWKPM
jgi:hypothetical protein